MISVYRGACTQSSRVHVAFASSFACATLHEDYNGRFQDIIVPTRVHHFDQEIAGRAYHIEVAQVGVNTWRAQVVTPYGGRSALMPFYDATPADAADRLADWLRRAHRNAAGNDSHHHE